MKLQLAMDLMPMSDALALARDVEEHIDILEVGTPFVIDRGMEPVRALATLFPNKQVLADLKIMDGGHYETALGITAGAHYVSILAVADNATIIECVRASRTLGGKVVADLLCVADIPSRVRELEDLGVDVIAVHTGADQQAQGHTPLADLRLVKSSIHRARVAVAGGISSRTIHEYVALQPDIIIVGSAITDAPDPREEARRIKAAMTIRP